MKRIFAVALLAASSYAATPETIYVSSENAKTYHARLECTGLKRSREAGTTRKGPKSAAEALNLKLCTRCNKPAKTSWSELVKAVSK